MMLLALFACTPEDTAKNDTSVFEAGCDRVHDAGGVLMFDIDDSVTTHTPDTAPSDVSKTTSVTGPLATDGTYVIAFGGQILISTDDGCNWAPTGNLPVEGDWDLVNSGDRLYAFDRAAGRGGRSDDQGDNWQEFMLDGPVLGAATVDPSDPDRVVVVNADGVQRTDDGGVTWTSAGTLPAGFGTTAAAIAPTNLDAIVIVGNGVQYSMTGGTTWTDVTEKLDGALSGTGVAISPDNGDVWWASGMGVEGPVVQRTTDRGATWAEVLDNSDDGEKIVLPDDPKVWAVAGDVMRSVTVSTTDSGVELYITTAGTGSLVQSIGTYLGITDIVAEADHMIATVHAVP